MENKENQELALSKRRQRFFDKCEDKAENILKNKNKVSDILRKARNIIAKLRNLPKCKALSENLCNFCDLLADHIEGTYLNFPLSTLVMLLVGILWAVFPLDPIPDLIPILGWLDDGAVVAGIAMTAQKDINEYLAWKEANSKIYDTEASPIAEDPILIEPEEHN